MGSATKTMIAKWGTRIWAMIGSTGGVEGASTPQSTICWGSTTMVRQRRLGEQVSVLEPGERCETDMDYQGSTPQALMSALMVASYRNVCVDGCWQRVMSMLMVDGDG